MAQTMSEMIKTSVIEYDEIRNLLNQKEPFIFIDRIIELEKKKHIIALKNVSGNDPWFVGHFPEKAIMPGALLLEAIAQTSMVLMRVSFPDNNEKLGLFNTVRGRFSRVVVPGDQLYIKVDIDKMTSQGGVVSAEAKVNAEVVCTGTLVFGLVQLEKDIV